MGWRAFCASIVLAAIGLAVPADGQLPPQTLSTQRRAQKRNVPRRPQIPKEKFRGAGKIKDMRPGAIQIVGESGEQWLVSVDARSTKIVYQGTSSPTFLKPGMPVRFQNAFDRQGNALLPLKTLDVFTPDEKTRLGIFPDAPGNKGGKNAGKKAGGDAAGKEGGTSTKLVQYNVVGRLQSMKDGIISVATGSAIVRARLSKEATIKVAVSDYRMVKAGDKVEVEGWHLPGQERFVDADRLTITAARRIALPSQPRQAKSNRKKRSS